MANVELIMPKMGESIMEATILTWLKKPGDKIEQDESVLEVATDKVDTEVPSTHAGILQQILAKEGEVVKVGSAIAIISTGGEATTAPAAPQAAATPAAMPVKELVAVANGNGAPIGDFKSASRFYSPLVKSIAKEEGVAVAELESIPGTGQEGRVTKKDIMAYMANRKLGAVVQATAAPVHTPAAPSTATANGRTAVTSTPSAPLVPASINAGDEIIEMDRMRKMIAERMVDSKRISPHVTSFVEADVTGIVFWRNKWKNEFQKREGDALTFTPIFIEAVVQAIKDYPMINVQVDGDRIIKKKDINIGMAVALPTGNLIVPVIKNADQYNLSGLAKIVNDLAKRARENKLKPDDLSGGTFTISNVGSFGNVMGTPIIMQPQVAIMALGAVQK
ncbi:MAG: 2-oxo acid dehydrogenase subunit E2, partial [Cytophagia bacterium]|nr:2-oxo acid dehydrogenase subunit E2 [Cytophagia bacterium]